MKILPALLFLLAACGSSKEPALYALDARPGTPQHGGPRIVELRRPAIAGYLDRADIVTRVQSYQLSVNTGERWAEPLGDMIGRVLSRDLTSRLADTQVYLENSAVSTTPDLTVAVIVESFDTVDGKVRLVAQVVVETVPAPHTSQLSTIELTAQPSGSSTEALVGTMSGLLADLSDRIAVMLRQMPIPPPAAAPRATLSP